MKGRQIVLGRLFGRDAAALMQDGRLEDLIVDPVGAAPLAPGAICRAKVDRLVKGQGGVFLRLPQGARGFLRDRSGLREGQSLLVQVSGSAEDGKAVPVSSRLNFRGRHVIVTPGIPGVNVSRRIRDTALREALAGLGEAALAGMADPPGLVFRSMAAMAGDDEIATELARLLDLAQAVLSDREGAPELLLDAPEPAELAWYDWADPPPDDVLEHPDAFEISGAEAAVLDLLDPRVDLGGAPGPRSSLCARWSPSTSIPAPIIRRRRGSRPISPWAAICRGNCACAAWAARWSSISRPCPSATAGRWSRCCAPRSVRNRPRRC